MRWVLTLGGKVGPRRPTSVRGKSLSFASPFSLLCQKKIMHGGGGGGERLRSRFCDYVVVAVILLRGRGGRGGERARTNRCFAPPYDRNENMQIFRPLFEI